MDSGTTNHLCNSRSLFSTWEKCTKLTPVELGNNSKLGIFGIGSVEVSVGNDSSLLLEDVLFVPGINRNLISVFCLCESGYNVLFTDLLCTISKDGRDICSINSSQNLWSFGQNVPISQVSYAATSDLWHLKFNHLNERDLRKMVTKQMVKGLDVKPGGAQFQKNCVGCALGKQHREELVALVDKPATERLDLVHSDLCGPLSRSINGFKYILTFIDDSSRMSWVYLLRKKSETFSHFKVWHAAVERQSGRKLKALRTDKGGEYLSAAMLDFLEKLGIENQFTQAGTPQSNGVAERFNQTLLEAVRCMLHTTGTRKGLWQEAVFTANHTKQRSPHSGLKENKTPYELWHRIKPSVQHLHVFGCKVSVHIQDKYRKKLDPKSFPGIFVGYGGTRRGFRIWTGTRIVESRDVIFYEDALLSSAIVSYPPANTVASTDFAVPDTDENSEDEPDQLPSNSLPLTDIPRAVDDSSSSEEEPDGEHNEDIIEAQGPGSLNAAQTEQLAVAIDPPDVPSQLAPLDFAADKEGGDNWDESAPNSDELIGNLPAAAFPKVSFDDVNSPIDEPEFALADEDGEEDPPGPRRGSRDRKAPKTLHYRELGKPVSEDISRMAHMSISALGRTPEDWNEAMACPERESWLGAIRREVSQIEKHGTYSWAALPLGRKAVQSKWVFKLKPDPKSDTGVKFKCRIVAKGFSQKAGIDYAETYSPVVKLKSFRELCAIAVERDMHIHHMDVSTAFLHGELKEDIYMYPPEGSTPPEGCTGSVWKLNKTIYGLKQSPRCWNERLDKFLSTIGFSRLLSDFGVYSRGTGDSQVLMVVYVDDLGIASSSLPALETVKSFLCSEFDMTDFGEMTMMLGIKVTRDWKNGTISLSQGDYISDVLTKFRQDGSHTKVSPLDPGQAKKLTFAMKPSSEEERTRMEKTPYRKAVGCLIYLVNCTRPDIAFAVSLLSRFCNDPGPKHWEGVQHVLQYLKGTQYHGLVYQKSNKGVVLSGYSDSDWGSDMERRRSTSGFVFLMSGAAVSWHSKLQKSCAQSSGEAEKVAIGTAAMEVLWQWQLLRELRMPLRFPVQVWADSTAAMAMIENPVNHEQTKHIDLKWNLAWDTVEAGCMKVNYIHTSKNLADLLTKVLTGVKTKAFREGMGVKDVRKIGAETGTEGSNPNLRRVLG